MTDETPYDIQKQIDHAREYVDAALNEARDAINAWRDAINASLDAINSITSTKQENTTPPTACDTPYSEGFWRDIDGDVWACDCYGHVRLIAGSYHTDGDHREIYDLSYNYDIQVSGPFTKIDNPFIEREDHAD